MKNLQIAGVVLVCFGLTGCFDGLTKGSQPTMTLSEAICEVQNSLIETSRGQDEARAGMKLAKATVSLQLGVKDSAELSLDGELVKGIVTWGPSAKGAREATTGNTLTIEFEPAAIDLEGNHREWLFRQKSLGRPLSESDMKLLGEIAGSDGLRGSVGPGVLVTTATSVEPKDCRQFALKVKAADQ